MSGTIFEIGNDSIVMTLDKYSSRSSKVKDHGVNRKAIDYILSSIVSPKTKMDRWIEDRIAVKPKSADNYYVILSVYTLCLKKSSHLSTRCNSVKY